MVEKTAIIAANSTITGGSEGRDQPLQVEGRRHARFVDDEVDEEPGHVDAVLRNLLGL